MRPRADSCRAMSVEGMTASGATWSLPVALAKVRSQSDLPTFAIVRCRPRAFGSSSERNNFPNRSFIETVGATCCGSCFLRREFGGFRHVSSKYDGVSAPEGDEHGRQKIGPKNHC